MMFQQEVSILSTRYFRILHIILLFLHFVPYHSALLLFEHSKIAHFGIPYSGLLRQSHIALTYLGRHLYSVSILEFKL